MSTRRSREGEIGSLKSTVSKGCVGKEGEGSTESGKWGHERVFEVRGWKDRQKRCETVMRDRYLPHLHAEILRFH